MQLKRVQIMALPMYNTVLRFSHHQTKILINCVMANKMARNERMGLVKHIYIIHDECVSVAVKYTSKIA